LNKREPTALGFTSHLSIDTISEQAMWRLRSAVIVACVMVAEILSGGCTPIWDARDIVPPPPYDAQLVRFPPWAGPKRKLQIQEITIPAVELERYPALTSAQVGKGLSRLLVDTLAATGRFDLLEQRAPLIQRLSNRLQRSANGEGTPTLAIGAEEEPLFFLSARLFDVALCTPNHWSTESPPVSTCRTSLGVQIRISDPSGQFVPGATHPVSPQGRYVHAQTMPLFGDDPVSFDQSAMGRAATKALRHAVLQAIERLERLGW
jgi:hypothetical protein